MPCCVEVRKMLVSSKMLIHHSVSVYFYIVNLHSILCFSDSVDVSDVICSVYIFTLSGSMSTGSNAEETLCAVLARMLIAAHHRDLGRWRTSVSVLVLLEQIVTIDASNVGGE